MSETAPSAQSGTALLVLIASVARNGSIGQGGELVWHEPEDQRWFRRQTLGCPVIMGRKTWDSLPARFRPLPGRDNIVVSRQPGWSAPGATLAHSLSDAITQARRSAAPRHVVIGGGQLYAEALALADPLLLTEIDADLAGDTLFPAWNRADFTEISRETHRSAGATPCDYAFVTYQRQR